MLLVILFESLIASLSQFIYFFIDSNSKPIYLFFQWMLLMLQMFLEHLKHKQHPLEKKRKTPTLFSGVAKRSRFGRPNF